MKIIEATLDQLDETSTLFEQYRAYSTNWIPLRRHHGPSFANGCWSKIRIFFSRTTALPAQASY